MQTRNIRKLFDNTEGRVFTAKFIKKENFEVRVMNARNKVKKHLKGGKSTIAHKHNVYGTYDMRHMGYRSFDLRLVISARVDGVHMDFQTEEEALVKARAIVAEEEAAKKSKTTA